MSELSPQNHSTSSLTESPPLGHSQAVPDARCLEVTHVIHQESRERLTACTACRVVHLTLSAERQECVEVVCCTLFLGKVGQGTEVVSWNEGNFIRQVPAASCVCVARFYGADLGVLL